MLASISDHRGNWVRSGVRWPRITAVMEIVETQQRVGDQWGRDLLAECGHQAELRLPCVAEHLEEVVHFHTTGEGVEAVLGGEAWHEEFILSRVGILPESFLGMRERLGGIVRGHAYHRYTRGESAKQEFPENMVAAHETTENGDADRVWRSLGVVEGRMFAENPWILCHRGEHRVHVRLG